MGRCGSVLTVLLEKISTFLEFYDYIGIIKEQMVKIGLKVA